MIQKFVYEKLDYRNINQIQKTYIIIIIMDPKALSIFMMQEKPTEKSKKKAFSTKKNSKSLKIRAYILLS